MKETGWVLTGRYDPLDRTWLIRRRKGARGSRSSVELDWSWALEREERHADVAGFWHTHPSRTGVAPSRRDLRTMQAWCTCLGKPLLCVISCKDEVCVYIFEDGDSQPVQVQEISRVSSREYQIKR